MPFSTGSRGGFVPRVLHPARGGLSSVGILGAHLPAVLLWAVPWAAVLLAGVYSAAGLVAAVSWAAGLVAAVSWAAVLLAVVSWAGGLVAVLSAVQIFPDLPVLLCPFLTLDGGAAVSTPPTVPLGAALVADFFPLSRRALGNFLCFTGGGLSVLWLLATLAARLPGALQKPVTTGITGPADVVAEVLGLDLESRALGD
ncbi:hypothetical protein NDU88_002940 [Pleurodeles waltl]|uniref:Uncharacterized protein n=1 Tax=Pleurodeles waltl TaxID=8319 RepID=A0AAV7RDL2_PLEWA|nr:hypothetical protein NDU88_002940 [Pleurodeles waltl]